VKAGRNPAKAMRNFFLTTGTAILALALPLWLCLGVAEAGAERLETTVETGCRRESANLDQQATEVHHAGLVVDFGSDRPAQSFCIEFTEDWISGLDLLERSGLPVITSGGGLGAAVCAIDGVGSSNPATYSTCFGEYPDYWAYYQLEGGTWHMSSLGASSAEVRDGTVEGWAWGANARPELAPELCPVSNPPPTPQIIPTAPPHPEASSPPATVDEPQPSDANAAEGTSNTHATIATPADSATRTQPAGPVTTPTPTGVSTAGRTTSKLVRANGEDPANGQSPSDHSSGGSGAPIALIAFGVIAVVLLGATAVVIYRRRSVV